MQKFDTIIIGAGVVGLCTALALAKAGRKVAVLEKSTAGNPLAASGGKTRSIRKDYLNPLYIAMAARAQQLWRDLEREAKDEFYIQCGLLNLSDPDYVAPGQQSYAANSIDAGGSVLLAPKDTPYMFQSQMIGYDASGGIMCLPPIMRFLCNSAKAQGALVCEHTPLNRLAREGDLYVVNDAYQARDVIFCAGYGTNEALAHMDGPAVRMPLKIERPKEVRYYIVPDALKEKYTAPHMPIFACLDISVYGHPIVPGLTEHVKLSNYLLPGDCAPDFGVSTAIDVFAERFMPELAGFKWIPVEDTDLCQYDYTGDLDFIIGRMPGYENAYLFGGGNGTAFKFAPVIGALLCDISMGMPLAQEYKCFDPARFIG